MSFSYAVDIEGNSQDIGCCVLAIERLSLAWFYCRCLPAPPLTRRPRPDPRPPAAPAGRTAQAPGGTPATARQGAPAAADASGDDERCFEIRRIELEGAGHLGESARRHCWRPTRGAAWASASSMRCSRPSPTITWIAATSPRAYLPQQDLASGTLRIIVVEGRLEGLDAPRWPARANWR